MSDSMSFTPVTVRRPGLEHLAFSILLPEGWQQLTPPDEAVDLDQPTTFVSLFAAMTPYATIVLAVGARPAYSDGAVDDWARYLAAEHGLTVHKSEALALRSHRGVRLDCTKPSDDGEMRIWAVFIEDGGRLYNLTAMAPQPLFQSVMHLFGQMLMSFEIADKRGPNAALLADDRPDAAVDTPPAIEHPRPDVHIPPIDDDDPHANAYPITDSTERATQAADVALADDAASLDPEHPMNVRLRDSGAGLVPNVIMRADREKFATVAAGAIVQLFRVPYGWHVIDDGRRTLVFDAGGRYQINLNLRPGQPGHDADLLNCIHVELYQGCTDLEHMRFEVGGMHCMGIRNLLIDGERLWQTYLVKDIGQPDHRLVCRVTTSTEEDMTFALNTAEVILTTMHTPPAERTDEPQWWREARQFEAQDRLQEAEKVIEDAIDHAGVYVQIGHLYELRMLRKQQEGDRDAAIDAYRRSMDWMRVLASSATSGGEGTAYMHQLREHESRLTNLLGFNPGES